MLASEVEVGDRLSVHQADLMSDEGWAEAVDGCDYVLHVASPFPPSQPKDPDELIVPAREGTLRVLRAALDAGVKRVVVTSSVAAVRNGGRTAEEPLTEEDWTDPDKPGLTPYVRSKTIAEQAAWALVRERDQVDRLTTVNPGAIIGPVLSDDRSYSLQAIERMLDGMPGLPRLGFNFVDVRDVAALEAIAMSSPEAGGQRFIAVERWLWMSDVAEILRERLGDRASKVPSRNIPDFLVKAMSLFDSDLRSITGELSVMSVRSGEKARARLGWKPRPSEETIVDCAESLLAQKASARKAA
jgi:nucleoside-diphosphate-sugar epimerase